MSRFSALLVSAALTVTVSSAAPVLTLQNSGAVAGNPGAILEWKGTLTADPAYFTVITSVQSTFADFPGGVSGLTPGVSAILPLLFADPSVKLAPGAPMNVSVASVQIRPDAVPGASEGGQLFVTYDLYDATGQQVFPDDDFGFLTLDASILVTNPIPEPSTYAYLALAGVAALALRRK